MPSKIAFLFPGQGSQYVGMGKDLADAYPGAKEIFEQVDDVCGKPVSRLCAEGPLEELTLTENLQPAITAVNLACLSCLNEVGINPAFSGGHSLGEYAALAASGVISFYDALRLVHKRGALMHREAGKNPGAMAAIIGVGRDVVKEIVVQAREDQILAVANYNSPEQTVVTGEKAAVSRAVALTKEKKGKAVPLKVSGAWHCGLMSGAVDEFRRFLKDIPFTEPISEILLNVTAQSEKDPEIIKDLMAKQLTSPVRWCDISQNLLDQNVDMFVEVGPRQVLCGLLKKTMPPGRPAGIFHVEDVASLEALRKEAF